MAVWMKKKATPSKRRLWGAIILIALLLVAAVLAWSMLMKPAANTDQDKKALPSPTVNYNPATEQEKADSEQHKKELEQKAKQEQAGPQLGVKSVIPIISSWGQAPDQKDLEVAAFIPGSYEDGGTCTLTLVKAGAVITKTTAGHKDVNRTSCARFIVPYGELTTGTWEATVGYGSATAKGTSAKQQMEVR